MGNADVARLERHLSVLSSSMHDFSELTTDPTALLEHVARRVAEVVDDCCIVLLLSEDGMTLIPSAAYASDPEALRRIRGVLSDPITLAQNPISRGVIERRELFVAPRLDLEEMRPPQMSERAFVESMGLHSLLVAPLVARDLAIGALMVGRFRAASASFDGDDASLARSLADCAALTITNARLYAAERSARESAERAREASRASAEAHRFLFEEGSLPSFLLDVETQRVVAANLAAIRLYGYTKAEFLTLTLATDDRFVVLNDVSERLQAEAALERLRQARASDRAFSGFFEAAPDGVVVADANGTIVLVNARAEQLFGYPRAEIVGRRIEMLVPERFRGSHPAHRTAYMAAPRARAMGTGRQLFGLRRDGSEFPVEISLIPLQTPDGLLVASAIRDITERKLADEQRFRLAALVEASNDAIIGKTLGGIVTSWNEGAQRIFGYTAAEMVGRSIALLIPPDRLAEERDILDTLRRGVALESFDTVRVRKDGRSIHVSMTSSPVRDTSGAVVGAAKVAREITDRKLAELALARARDSAEAANRELEAFSYSVAHDLRAPLRGMNGFAQLLLDGYATKLDAEGREWLTDIVSNAKKMSALIDALLSLARLTRSRITRTKVDLSLMVRACGEQLAAREPDRRVDLVVEEGLDVDADPVLARALVDNLLGNAWKFTSKVKDARVEFGAKATDGDPIFFVKDNGAGFDMAYAGKLFAPFQRLHGVEEFPGTGIGLATVQRIVRRHGGTLWAAGEVGKGATFQFTLPSPEGLQAS